jgi:hypothetical protein
MQTINSERKMTETKETAYNNGNRAAWVSMLNNCSGPSRCKTGAVTSAGTMTV